METKRVGRLATTPLRRVAVVVLIIILLQLIVASLPQQAEAQSCQPPVGGEICRGDSGGGSGGDDGGGDDGGSSGDPGDEGGDGNGGGGSGGSGGEEGGDTGGGDDGSGEGTDDDVSDQYRDEICAAGASVDADCEYVHATYGWYYSAFHGGWYLIDYTCLPTEVCEGSDDEPGDPGRPCIPGYDPATGITFICDRDDGHGFDWGYNINTWTRVPPHKVARYPYPRWLVSLPGQLRLIRDPLFSVEGGPQGAGGQDGFWSDTAAIPNPPRDEPVDGDIKNYRIGVRWRMGMPGQSRFGGSAIPDSCWDFDERGWNVSGGYAPAGACGDTVAHTYETSSYGKPENGVRFDHSAEGCDKVGAANLPAYQVTVPTYWIAEWADEWDQYHTWTEWGSCGCAGSEPSGVPHTTSGCSAPPGICIQPGEWYGKVGEEKGEWRHHYVGWYPIDLREFGEAHWYYTSYKVTPTGQGGDWCPGHTYVESTGTVVPIPVIEAQSIIVDPCRLYGTCGDLNPQVP